MCSECWKNPCDPRCPNAPEPAVVYYCELCGDEIYEGDEYWELLDSYFCERCINQAQNTAEVDRRW